MKKTAWSRVSAGIIVIALVVVIGVLSLWEWIGKEKTKTKPNVSFQPSNTTPLIQLSLESQRTSGIKVAKLKVTTKSKPYEAYGEVILPQLLVDARNRFIAAQAQLQKTSAQLTASSKEYLRLKNLHQHHDVSLKNLQMMEATFLNDEAAVFAAKNALQAEIDALRIQWGNPLADWVMNQTQSYLNLVQLNHYLIKLTLPQGIFLASPPLEAVVKAHNHSVQEARFISKAPITDRQIQGLSFYFLLKNKSTFLPGMNIAAYIPTSKSIHGTLIPRKAVVWWQGSPWVYAEMSPREYQRVKINTRNPTKNDFLVQSFNVKKPIVIYGAQILLSQEVLGPNTASSEEED